MNNETLQIIKDRYGILPDNVTAVITDYPWAEKVGEISKNRNLNNEQSNLLAIEVCILVLGLEVPRKVAENIIKNVGLSENQIESVLNDVEELIIKPILDKVSTANTSESPQVNTSTPVFEKNLEQEKTRPTLTNIPNYSDYDSGKDPYREPLE